MRKCGCEYINYGIESLSPDILKYYNKGLTTTQIHNGVNATLEVGIVPGLNFMWGAPGDTKETFKRGGSIPIAV